MRLVVIVLLVIVLALVGAGWLNFLVNSDLKTHHIDPAAIRGK